MHPLDTNFGELGLVDDGGAPLCVGAFQPIGEAAQSADYDMILGMSFCMIFNLNWLIRSTTRFEEMKPWTSGGPSSETECGKKEGEVKSFVGMSREAALSLYSMRGG